MNVENALRFLDHEAQRCRNRDSHEALCLLVPALLRALDLRPMNGYEAEEFRSEFRLMIEQDFRFDPNPSTVGCPK